MYRVPVRDTELWQRLVAIWAEFQQCMVYDALYQWQKRLEACIIEHYLPDIPVATHHNRFFSEPPTFEGIQQTFSQIKKFCISQVSALTFLGGGQVQLFSSEITFRSMNNTVENDFFSISQGTVATIDKWGGQNCKVFMSNVLRI